MFNPYSVDEPATDLFYGRKPQVKRLAGTLMAPKAGSYALVGGRRFGKTSLLYALEQHFLDSFEDTNAKAYYRVVPVYVSLLSDEINEWTDFFSLATTFLNDQVQAIWPDALLDGKQTVSNTRSPSTQSAYGSFTSLVKYLSKRMRSQWGPIRVVLLIDETEEILDRPWRHILFNKLRWLTYESRHTNKLLKIVMSGSSDFYKDVSQKGSPLWGVLKPEFLKAFIEEAALQLIQEPCNEQLPEASAQLIVRLSGGHPFIIQYIMHELWEQGISTAQPDRVRQVADKFKSENWKQLEQWKQDIGKTACQVYWVLSEQTDWMDQKESQSLLSATHNLTPALSALCYHGFVIHDGSWQRYRWVGELFRQWFLTNQKITQKPQEKGEQGMTELPSEVKAQAKETYTDFHLHISLDGDIRTRSDEGERIAKISLDVPSNVSLTVSLIEENKTSEKLLKDLGKLLYELVFPYPIHAHFNQTEAAARARGQKVRIRLTIEPDALAHLPWEFTYRKEGGYFLAVHPKTVLSRYLDLPVPPNRVRRREGPLHLLLIVANPGDQAPLDPDEWDQIITDALAGPFEEGMITIKRVKQATRREIMDALLERKPDIVQFVGHGIYRNGKGYLALVDGETGKTWLVDDARFANIFLGADDHLGLVSLETCESAKSDSPRSFLGIAPQIVQRGVPAVVAMQYSVLVSTAKVFLEDFYKAVAARKPVDWAVQWARNAVSLEAGLDNREFATLVLYMRAKDGNIF